jgi:tetratricopeptide (TPR) repeat protein
VTRTLFRAAVFLATVALQPAALASPQADSLRRQGYELAYNLDSEAALVVMKQAVRAAPDDPANHNALASLAWFHMLLRRGSLTVEEYLGPVPSSDIRRAPPPSDLAAAFLTSVNTALSLAKQQVQRRPSDAGGYYNLGAAVGQIAAYTASEEGRVFAAFRAARRAFDAHERVIALDARRKDAGLVVGTYRYLVATLSLFKRWFAYLAGFGGNKALALRMLEDCADYPSDVQAEARFALLVIYSRENRFDDVLRVLETLRAAYPRNRLLWLETGATLLRAGRPVEALTWIDDGLVRLNRDTRPRAFGEEAMWYYKRASALTTLGRGSDARGDIGKAASLPCQIWVRGRIFTALGHIEDLAGNRSAARTAYARAVELGRSVNDDPGVQDARHWLDNPYRGTSAPPTRH